jgi:hypothetical protein
VGPHDLIFHRFLSDRELFDKVSFKGQKNAINERFILRSVWLIENKVTNKGRAMISLCS